MGVEDVVLSELEQRKNSAIQKGLDKKFPIEKTDETWEEINNEFGKPYKNGESLRCAIKDYQMALRGTGSEKALPYAITDEEKIKKLEEKKLEIQKEKVKYSSLRIDLNKTVRETARTELLYEEILRVINNYNTNSPLPLFQRLQTQNDERKYVLAFGDVHFGKQFESITNSYSVEEVYSRFNKLYNEIYDLVLEKHINTLYVVCTGDLIEGITLRISQIQAVQIGLVDQTIQFMIFLGEWLQKLSEIVNIVYYTVKSSNHSQIRPFGSKPNEFVAEDMERVIFAHLKDKFVKNPRVNIVENSEKYSMFDIFNYSNIALHGHEYRNHNNLLKDLSWKFRKFFSYAWVGHKHCGGLIVTGEGETNNCEIIKVPSIMASDVFADELLVGSKAGAILVEFTKNQGKRSITDIILN